MEYAQQTLSDILLTYPQDYFWSKSQKTDAFRFSTIFTKFIKQYIKMLQQAHASRRLHQWGNSLCDEIVINHNDFQNISFQNAPVEPEEGDDFDELKKLDYSNLASLVEHVHWACSLPKISDNSSPELLAFLGVLKHSDIYDETFIRTHYSLWSFKKRDTFMRTIQSKQEYRRFQEMTDSEFNTLAPFKFSKRFRKGFWVIKCDMTLRQLQSAVGHTTEGDISKSVIFDGCLLAKEVLLLETEEETNNKDKWVVMSKVWVELMSCAASHIRATSHVQQVSKGGELISVIWLLMAHFGLGDQF
ncbi:hypothetical protein LguiA_025554 [Lonicera macranthoides]